MLQNIIYFEVFQKLIILVVNEPNGISKLHIIIFMG